MLQEKLYESGIQGQIKSMFVSVWAKNRKNSYMVKHCLAMDKNCSDGNLL